MKTISVSNLQKSFKDQKVLDGISFTMPKGQVLALLGPNGAGKTTTVRILSTLLKPDGGEVLVNGHDVLAEADKVRSSIGLTGQFAAVDEYLTGEENLRMVGRLYRMPHELISLKTRELLTKFDLNDKKPVKHYSGGMKRKLDLAMSLIASPPVLFLDEPTTGLDPPSRLTMWDIIRELASKGTTILLTTQNMEEADKLADRIIVIDKGTIIAEGTPEELKAKVGSKRIVVNVGKDFDCSHGLLGDDVLQHDTKTCMITMKVGGTDSLMKLLQRLSHEKIPVESITLREPTLDDVFLTLTGHKAEANGVQNGK
jgi:ABC-2 type transport system ATP-binding protein